MAAITKSALKAIKFYKHVVQSVEKFIQKGRIWYWRRKPGIFEGNGAFFQEAVSDNAVNLFNIFLYIFPSLGV